jgi:hypothetical protein
MRKNGVNSYLIRHDLFHKKASKEIYSAITKMAKNYPSTDGQEIVLAYKRLYFEIMSKEGDNIWEEDVQPVLNDMLGKADVQMNRLYIWRNEIGRFFETVVRPIAESVAETTMKLLQALNLTPQTPKNERSKALTDFLDTQKGRAINLGRTATTHAMNRGALMAVSSSGLPWNKAWVSIKDENTRNAHLTMNANDYIPIDQFFVVGGEPMLFPTDGSAGASISNIANCRCGMTFKLGKPSRR